MNSIRDFKGLHTGKRLFILASGPSLADHDLSMLDRRIVMGLNRSVLSYERTHYHCVMDHRLYDLHGEALKKTRYLFTLEGRPWGIPLKLLGAEGFSWDLEEGIYSGYTIAYFALQVAVYMGFSEIYYLGLDLHNQGSRTHFFGSDFHSIDHNDTEYPRMRKMFRYGSKVLNGNRARMYNCSPVCDLDCIPKFDYEKAVSL